MYRREHPIDLWSVWTSLCVCLSVWLLKDNVKKNLINLIVRYSLILNPVSVCVPHNCT